MLAGHCRHLNEKYIICRLLNVKLICCSCTAIRFFLLVVRNLTNAADKTNPYLHDVKQKSVIVQKKNEKRIDMGKLWKVTSNFPGQSFFTFFFHYMWICYIFFFLGKREWNVFPFLLHSLEFRVIFPSGFLPSKSCELSTPCYFHFGWWKKRWIYTFFQEHSCESGHNGWDQSLNSACRFHFFALISVILSAHTDFIIR